MHLALKLVISVQVKAELKSGRLLGDSDRFASIQILDLDPLNILKQGFQATLPEVQTLNFEMVEDVDLSALSACQVEELVSAGGPRNVQRIFRGSAEVEADRPILMCGCADQFSISRNRKPICIFIFIEFAKGSFS